MKIYKITLLSILTLFAINSCSKDEVGENEEVTYHITGFSASVEGQESGRLRNYLVWDSTKYIYHNFWNRPFESEKVKVVVYNEQTLLRLKEGDFKLTAVDQEKENDWLAYFDGTLDFSTNTKIGINLQALYPSNIYIGTGKNEIHFKFPNEQECESNSSVKNTPMFAFKDVRVNTADHNKYINGESLKFYHLAGFLRFTIKGNSKNRLKKIEVEPLEYPTAYCATFSGSQPNTTQGEGDDLKIELSVTPDETSENDTYLMAVPYGETLFNFKFIDSNDVILSTKNNIKISVLRAQFTPVSITLN